MASLYFRSLILNEISLKLLNYYQFLTWDELKSAKYKPVSRCDWWPRPPSSRISWWTFLTVDLNRSIKVCTIFSRLYVYLSLLNIIFGINNECKYVENM
jgi:hypothetical protein